MSIQISLGEMVRSGDYIAFKDGKQLTPKEAEAVGWLGLIDNGVYISREELRISGSPVDALVRRLTHQENGERVHKLHPITAGLVIPGFIRALGTELGMEFVLRCQGQFPNDRIGAEIIDAKDLLAQGNWGLLG